MKKSLWSVAMVAAMASPCAHAQIASQPGGAAPDGLANGTASNVAAPGVTATVVPGRFADPAPLQAGAITDVVWWGAIVDESSSNFAPKANLDGFYFEVVSVGTAWIDADDVTVVETVNVDGLLINRYEATLPAPITVPSAGTYLVSIAGDLTNDAVFPVFFWQYTSAVSTEDIFADLGGGFVEQVGLAADLAFILESNVVVDPDTDNDGLTDAEEGTLGTLPNNPDSDGDGLMDGEEVDVHGSNPLDGDTDDDGLGDNHEVIVSLTDPTNPDSDGDGLGDAADPMPNDPGATVSFIEDMLRELATEVSGYDFGLILAPNQNAAKGRRTAISNKLSAAANSVAEGNYLDAIDVLNSLLDKLDGSDPDWMCPGAERDALRDEVTLAIALIVLL